MAHLDAYLQPCPGYGWQGGPEFKTQIVELQSGRERRNAMWSQARHRYAAPYVNISIDAYMQIKKMHLVCRGQLHCFRFVDELDHTAEAEIFAIGDGVIDTFQLQKVTTIDGVSYNRQVFALSATPTIYINGIAEDGVTVDLQRGTVVFDDPPADDDVLSWSGDFDIWVRFTQDFLPFTLDNPQLTNGSVDLIEVAPPPTEV